jgi:hypothetical protein
MMFSRLINAVSTRTPFWFLPSGLPLFLFLTSCGIDEKTGLVRRSQDNGREVDTHDCSQDSSLVAREFIALRNRLTAKDPKCSAALDKLAQSQAGWLLKNPDLRLSVRPHEQREGTAGFSGASLAARMRHQNLKSDLYVVAESIALGDFDIWKAHLSSVLHRSIFLAPGLIAFGHSQNSAATVLTAAVYLGKKPIEPVFYPTESEVVGVARLMSERPIQDLTAVGMGFPISVHFPWGCSDLRVIHFNVKHAGRDLAGKIFTKRDLPKLRASEVFLVTDEILPAGKTIDVSAEITCESHHFRKNWHFNTLD